PTPRNGTPPTATVPRRGRSRPAMAHNSVVLPAPDGPVTASICPGRTATDTSRSTASSAGDAGGTASAVSIRGLPRGVLHDGLAGRDEQHGPVPLRLDAEQRARRYESQHVVRQVDGAVAPDHGVVLAATALGTHASVPDRHGTGHPRSDVGVVGHQHDRGT